MVLTQVTTWHLAMTDRSRLRPKPAPRPDATVARAELPCPEFSEFLYRTVGGNWHWLDRLAWSEDDWGAWIDGVETWVAYVAGTPAGYFELLPRRDGTVHLVLFGLLPWAIGQGLGGWLLTQAIERAWALGPQTVTVDTCSLDGPYALTNYQARGFAVARIATATQNLAGVGLPPTP